MATTVNRYTGMASGMDTDGLVKSMTSNQQLKIDRLFAKKTTAEWKSTAITDTNNALRSFSDSFISVLSSKSMMKADAYKSMTVKGTSSSVSVTASSSAATGYHKIQVTQLATGAKATGAKFTTEGTLSNTSATLQTLANSDKRATEAFTPTQLKNADGTGMVDADGNAVMGFAFSINDKEFTFKMTDKLSDIMSTINSSGAGAKLSYSQLSNSFTLESTTTGVDSKLEVVESESNFFAALGLAGGDGQNVFNPTAGQNALAVIDGFEMESKTNTITADGMTFTLQSVTREGEAFEFTIERDVTKSVDQMKEFVSAINDLFTSLYTAYTTKSNRTYTPLTDEIKSAMSEKEIEDWDTKAKSGLLYRDNNLNSLMTGLRSALNANVDGSGTLGSIGISFGQYMAGTAPQLVIDEDKFKAALESDPEKVQNIMSKASTKASGDTPADAGGIVARVSAAGEKYTATTKTNDIQNLRNNVYDYTKRIAEQETKLTDMQDRLYLKYAAFEKALSSMQAQQDSLAGYFG